MKSGCHTKQISVLPVLTWLRKGFQACLQRVIFTVNHLLVGKYVSLPHLFDVHSSEHTINAQKSTEKQQTGARAPGSLLGTHLWQPFIGHC